LTVDGQKRVPTPFRVTVGRCEPFGRLAARHRVDDDHWQKLMLSVCGWEL